MLTDWVLMRRLAFELEARLRGARLIDAGLLADGRIALLLRTRGSGEASLLAFDLFGSPPLVTVEPGEPAVRVEPGFVRALEATLHGMILVKVASRRGDRLLRLTFAARSRFGVGDEVELYAELVPRFGNLVLVKRDVVVAAAKEFSLSENAARSVLAGMPYALPPLPASSTLVPKAFGASAEPQALLQYFESDRAMQEPLYVYRRDGMLLQAHVLPVERFADAQTSRETSLLALFEQLREQRAGATSQQGTERRRQAVLRRLDRREAKLLEELRTLDDKRRKAAERDALRVQGEQIFASLHELPETERCAAKERAAKLFVQYKKHGAALPHVEAREATVRAVLESVEALRWEVQRAGDQEIDDVETAAAHFDPAQRSGVPASKKKKRRHLEFRTSSGSRIIVGRSPIENADITFRLARPNDLWFHAQGIPGAHVILARDDRSPAPDDDLKGAAALAAFYSKGRAAAKVAVDYTQRKYVRKRPDAPPGLVWYTHPQTILTEPSATPEGLRAPAGSA
ncbi:MAG TPA: NFACT RNA binding domain-containing protein [Candidatus Baltobacteraceae bacterium]|nr:NFACT RNA binding domain-containing protein [Candidatus Baltobacteraceae bacterium]